MASLRQIQRRSPFKTFSKRLALFRSGTAECVSWRSDAWRASACPSASEFVMSGTVRGRSSPLPGNGLSPGITMPLLIAWLLPAPLDG